ncbi:MAG: hypothetical protein AAF431_14905 [Pseudomonadota bacterium]
MQQKQLYCTLVVALAISALLLWQFLHDGVPRHYILRRADMPSVSNWWGALILPALTWHAIGRINRRVGDDWPAIIYVGFLAGLGYGIVLSLSYVFSWEQLSSMMAPALLVIALFVPIFQAEYFLGFVLALSYSFGAVLPLAFAIVFALLGFLIYQFVRRGILALIKSPGSQARND